MSNNYLHSFFIYSSKKDLLSLAKKIKESSMGLLVEKRKEEYLGSNYNIIVKADDLSFSVKGILNYNFDKSYEKLWGMRIVVLDDKEMTCFSEILEKLNFKMYLLGVNGGWDATPFYLIGDLKKEEYETVINENRSRRVYWTLKRLNKDDKFFEKKEELELIEKLLLELGIKKKDLEDYCCKPLDYLFKKTVVESIMIDQADGLVNWLKARLGHEDGEAF